MTFESRATLRPDIRCRGADGAARRPYHATDAFQDARGGHFCQKSTLAFLVRLITLLGSRSGNAGQRVTFLISTT
jgi:hypothetical protein